MSRCWARRAAAADRLIVGLNSDASIQRLKGPDRPVQNETARGIVLASLGMVDLVLVFDEDTPIELIRAIRPEVLVKGADYRLDQVVGADVVQSYGGRVLLADLLAGHSTTGTIARVGAQAGQETGGAHDPRHRRRRLHRLPCRGRTCRAAASGSSSATISAAATNGATSPSMRSRI